MTKETTKQAWSVRFTSILFALVWLTLGSVPTYYATVEYTELKLAAKPAQDRKDLQQLGYIPQFVDSNEFAVIGR